MKNQIQIVSWLLTRKCNLDCHYCAIVKNYKNKPQSYPDLSHYHQKQMTTEYVTKTLAKIKLHNPGAFHLFYGGEPLLRKDLPDIINFCNDNEIHYTIITNNSDDVQSMMDQLLEKVDYIQGLTSSVDPLILDDKTLTDDDRYKKCVAGIERLQKYKGKINDLVAEITVDDTNIDHLYNLVKMLTDMGINSDITTIDVAKTNYYDFSNISSMNNLVHKTDKVKAIFQKIIDDKLNVHMADTLLMKIWDILPANLDCEIEDNVHNMTIDADGSVRLCLRLRGVMTPNMKAYDCFFDDGTLHFSYKRMIKIDKENYCQGCCWTCMIMSKMISEETEVLDNLIHKEVRDGR
jgi:MoaA/NifB/PqqE/SkfB family radical SAM enzyme